MRLQTGGLVPSRVTLMAYTSTRVWVLSTGSISVNYFVKRPTHSGVEDCAGKTNRMASQTSQSSDLWDPEHYLTRRGTVAWFL